MQKFPFLSLAQMLVLMRILLAGIFMAHAIVRGFNGTIERFGGFLETKGFIMAVAVVWAITVFEIIGGIFFPEMTCKAQQIRVLRVLES